MATAGTRLVTRGIVLRETITKETDKILTVLSEDYGKISVIAKGARRRNSKYAACAQILAWSEWTLAKARTGEWYYVHEGNTIMLFPELRENLTAFALGCYFAELTEAVALEENPSGPLLRHLLNGLYALGPLRKPESLVKPAFECKLLSLAGYEPLVDACAYCGRTDPVNPVLETVQGMIRCQTCGGNDNYYNNIMPLCGDSLAALRHMIYGDAKRLYAYKLESRALARLYQAVERFLYVQLDRKFRTLDFYKSLLPGRKDET